MEHTPTRCHGLQLTVTVPQGNRRELIQALEGFREKAVAEPGLRDCDFFEDLSEPNRFLWTEWWPCAEDVDRVRASQRFRALAAAVRLLGRLVRVHQVEGQLGTDDENILRTPVRG